MSPPALMIAAGTPAFLSSSSARSAAQPFTRPVGSTPPGRRHGSNQPSETSLALRQSSSTSATSGGAASSSISPRRRRLTGLSGLGAEHVVHRAELGLGALQGGLGG